VKPMIGEAALLLISAGRLDKECASGGVLRECGGLGGRGLMGTYSTNPDSWTRLPNCCLLIRRLEAARTCAIRLRRGSLECSALEAL